MPPPLPKADSQLLAQALRRTALSLWWEEVWRTAWAPLTVIGTGVAAALFDAERFMPASVHALVLLLWAGGVFYAARGLIRACRWPDRAACLARLDQASGLTHNPLSALEDKLATGQDQPIAQMMWQRHRARLLQSLARLKPAKPAPRLIMHDPRALRFAVLLLMVIGVVVANDRAADRVSRFFSPDISGLFGAPARLDAWLEPPAFTGRPPVFIARDGKIDANVAVPEGSTLMMRVTGGWGSPAAYLDDGADSKALEFSPLGDGGAEAKQVITATADLTVRKGLSRLVDATITVTPDAPPTIAWIEDPTATRRGALKLAYRIEDDWGAVSAAARVTLAAPKSENRDPLTVELPRPPKSRKQTDEQAFIDLTSHPWAGLNVMIELTAKDAAGHEGVSEPLPLKLPERIFTDPAAKIVIEARKQLARDPKSASSVASVLDALSATPEAWRDDARIYLGLRAAVHRLTKNRNMILREGIFELLWDIALAIEDGGSSMALRNLREAQQALNDALSRDAPADEIARLTQELGQAMQRYMQALAEQAQRNGQSNQARRNGQSSERLSSADLSKLLKEIEELSKTGAKEAARQKLAELQQLMERLEAGGMPGMSGEGQSGQGEAADQMMGELGQLMGRQQRLLDKTARNSRSAPQGQQGAGRQLDPALEPEQGSVRDDLGKLMEQLGEMAGNLPGAFGKADQAMRDARQALKDGKPEAAEEAMGRALDEMRKGTREFAREMSRQSMGGSDGDPESQDGQPRDPFGRRAPSANATDDGSTAIPNQMSRERARDILEELRRRASERSRSKGELDYLERLLDRF